MISKRILAACAILLATAWNGTGQEDKRPIHDINGDPFLYVLHTEGETPRADYYTEQGDTLKAIPYVGEYVECTIGRDSLKTRMKEIYYDNYIKHHEYDYQNLRIIIHLLFDSELNIAEIRMVTHSHCIETDKFVLDICKDSGELFKTTQWVKKDGFPDPSQYSFSIIVFSDF